MRIALATTNPGKAREIAAALAPFGIEVERPAALPPVVEDGATFAENARLKAASAARALGRPALAEDSGLVVEALGGEPGVRSARYAGEGATDARNNERLLSEIAARGLVDPKAAFVCHAVVCAPDGRVLAEAQGRVEGVVRGPPEGRGGFGYDPLFHWSGEGSPPGGVRFAELSPPAKDRVSHRGRAMRLLAERLIATAPSPAAGPAPGR
jgi:XTP/dITP diphosphohydrolase